MRSTTVVPVFPAGTNLRYIRDHYYCITCEPLLEDGQWNSNFVFIVSWHYLFWCCPSPRCCFGCYFEKKMSKRVSCEFDTFRCYVCTRGMLGSSWCFISIVVRGNGMVSDKVCDMGWFWCSRSIIPSTWYVPVITASCCSIQASTPVFINGRNSHALLDSVIVS